MHYIDLNIQTKGVCRDIRFLVTNIRNEDIVLGYPWLLMFEPQFDWTHVVINEQALPIVIWSVNPQVPRKEPIIAGTNTGEVKAQRLQESNI